MYQVAGLQVCEAPSFGLKVSGIPEPTPYSMKAAHKGCCSS